MARMVRISVRIPTELKERLRLLAQLRGVSMAQIVREALEWWAAQERDPG
jgi:predicted DNA-binding protein